MKHLFSLLLLLVSFLSAAQSERFKKKSEKDKETPPAQEEQQRPTAKPEVQQKESFYDKLVFGGGAGLSFGNNTNIFLAPQVGYRVTDNFIAGLGYLYSYTDWNQILTFQGLVNVDYTNQIHGPNLFGTFTILETLFLGVQGEILNHDAYIYQPLRGDFLVENRWTPVLFLQGGFFQPVGKNGFMQIGMRINLLHDEFSPYATSWSPIFQIYF